MKTRIIGDKEIFLNKFSAYGKKRNLVIRQLKDHGCEVIRERKEGCCSRVYLGYINEYFPLANYAMRVCRDGSVQFKHSKAIYSPLPTSLKSYSINKLYVDSHGNETQKSSELKVQDGKILYCKKTTS